MYYKSTHFKLNNYKLFIEFNFFQIKKKHIDCNIYHWLLNYI